MSLIPRDTSNSPTPFTPFPQDFWDRFFSQDFWPEPFRNLPFPYPYPFRRSSFPFPHSPFPARTVPYSELAIETSGDVRAKVECKEIPEAHLIVAELPGIEKDEVNVVGEDVGGYVKISAGDGRFSWRFRLPEDVRMDLLSWSMENGVLTVVVPKMSLELEWGWESSGGGGGGHGSDGGGGRNVRQIEITGSD